MVIPSYYAPPLPSPSRERPAPSQGFAGELDRQMAALESKEKLDLIPHPRFLSFFGQR